MEVVQDIHVNRSNMAKKRTNYKKGTNTGIPGLSFSWKRALGITDLRRTVAQKTHIPTTWTGIERKIGKSLIDWLFK